MLGQRVAILLDEYVSPGTTTITWNTRDESGKTVASGTYLYRLKIGNETSSKKMVLIR
jgi:flagellar hook assembly protein FlgD